MVFGIFYLLSIGSRATARVNRCARHDTVVERVVNWNEPDCQRDYADAARELAFMRLVRAIEPQVTPRCLSVRVSLARTAAKRRNACQQVSFHFHSRRRGGTNAFWDVPS